ncbi:MAG: TetR/AcrR family transcriptional regulator [Ktedonobacterales bacterium]|nr:TetR/AcrR family transcriptional regulator [Ktedonobacterales bacterium]
MRKGEATKHMIIARTAAVLNQRGFYASSLADIMAATGLEKGGIYNHFRGKDELALAAFDYSVSLTWACLRDGMRGKTNAIDRLMGLANAYCTMADDPPLPGGCPLLNTGVEAAGAHPALQARARAAMDALRRFIEHIVARGQERGEIRPECDGAAFAPVLIGAIEGGVLFARLYDDPRYVHRAVDHILHIIETELRATPHVPAVSAS